MGLCKTCRKGTGLYCFIHRTHVCDSCVTRPEHRICVVKTYLEWVQDSEYQWPPTCAVCHLDIQPDDAFRLGCLDIFHRECLDRHFGGLPDHTTPAGVTCPACYKPVIPSKSSASLLSENVRAFIREAPWAARLNLPVELDDVNGMNGHTMSSKGKEKVFDRLDRGNGGLPSTMSVTPSSNVVVDSGSHSPKSEHGGLNRDYSSASVAPRFSVAGLAARKGNVPVPQFVDSEEDKYKQFGRTALDEISSYPESANSMDTKRILALIAVFSSVIALLIIYVSLDDDQY